MAAPHVSGVAGLAYNVNPDISAADLKQIIRNTAQNNNGVPLLNAADVIADVVNYNANESYNTKLIIVDEQGNSLSGARVEIRQHAYYWFEIFHAAMTLDAVGDTIVYSGVTNSAGYVKLTLPHGRYYVLVDGVVAGEAAGGIEELSITYEDEADQRDRKIVVSTYTEGNMYQTTLQFHGNEKSEYINGNGFYYNIDINVWQGWLDTVDAASKLATDVSISPHKLGYGYIVENIPSGAYTLEVTIPGTTPRYYHILIPENQAGVIYRFEM